MRPLKVAGLLLLCGGLAACGSSSASASAAGGGQSLPTTSAEASATAPAATGTAAQQSGAPTAINPCDLVTAREAASLAGISLGAAAGGGPSPNGAGNPTCTYAIPQPWDFVWVTVAQEPDAATAQANWAQEGVALAQGALSAEPGGGPSWNLTFSDVTVPGADRASVGVARAAWTDAKGTVSSIVLYALKGSTYVSISNVLAVCPNVNVCGRQSPPAPTVKSMEAQMATSLGRLP